MAMSGISPENEVIEDLRAANHELGDPFGFEAKEEAEGKPVCLLAMLDELFAPEDAATWLTSADGGTGKTLVMVNLIYLFAEKLGFYVLTNIYFRKRTTRGWKDCDPHEHVHVVWSMAQLWYHIGEIKKQDPFAVIIVVLDEVHKFAKRIRWWKDEPTMIMDWWGENRKYRTVPGMITQKMKNVPNQLLQYVKWYLSKSPILTNQYNAAYGYHYKPQDLAFIIDFDLVRADKELKKKMQDLEEKDFKLEHVRDVLLIERGPWSGDRNKAKRDQICYISETSVTFSMIDKRPESVGKPWRTVNDREDWFPEFLEYISFVAPEKLGERILAFFAADQPRRETRAEDLTNTDIALHIYLQLIKAGGELSKNGHPFVWVTTEGGKRKVKMEANPQNLSRVCGGSRDALARRIEQST